MTSEVFPSNLGHSVVRGGWTAFRVAPNPNCNGYVNIRRYCEGVLNRQSPIRKIESPWALTSRFHRMVASAGLVRLAEQRDHPKIVEWIRRTRRSYTKIPRNYPASEEQPLECVSHHIIFHTSELFPQPSR
jgi:hypothetical protein